MHTHTQTLVGSIKRRCVCLSLSLGSLSWSDHRSTGREEPERSERADGTMQLQSVDQNWLEPANTCRVWSIAGASQQRGGTREWTHGCATGIWAGLKVTIYSRVLRQVVVPRGMTLTDVTNVHVRLRVSDKTKPNLKINYST